MDQVQSLWGYKATRVWWLRLRITKCAERHLGFVAWKAASSFKVIRRCVLFAFLKIPVKTEKMMLDGCFCCHWRPKVTLPSSGREAVKQLWIRCIRTCNSMENDCQCWYYSCPKQNKLKWCCNFLYPFIWQLDDKQGARLECLWIFESAT